MSVPLISTAPDVASVSPEGILTAVAPGRTAVNASTATGPDSVASGETEVQVLDELTEGLRAEPGFAAKILAALEVLGVDKLAEDAVIIKARIKTLPGQQWGAGRAYNAIVKRVFQERGIEIPFPHQVDVPYGGPAAAGSDDSSGQGPGHAS